jgi:hypothetical protein
MAPCFLGAQRHTSVAAKNKVTVSILTAPIACNITNKKLPNEILYKRRWEIQTAVRKGGREKVKFELRSSRIVRKLRGVRCILGWHKTSGLSSISGRKNMAKYVLGTRGSVVSWGTVCVRACVCVSLQLSTQCSPQRTSKLPNSETHWATRQQAFAKTPVKWSAYQILSANVIYL